MSSGRTFAAVLIDFDGTIVDSEPRHCIAHRRFLATQGIEVGDEVVYGNIGKSDRAFYLELMASFGKRGDVDAWMAAKTELLLELYRSDGLELRPGVAQLLDHARHEGLACCVVTSTERRVASLALELVGFAQRLPMRVCYEDVTARKPNPEPYLLAASRLGVPIERCLVIEDSVSGVTAGVAAGANTVGLVGLTDESALLAAGAVRCVHSLEELIPLGHQPGATTTYRRAIRK
jgi:HAD superfamily hydrolase (TIGR01509 family)